MTTFVKPVVFLCLSAPLLWLGLQISIEVSSPTVALGADPGEAIVHFLGEWGIRVLLLAFAISPLQKALKQSIIGRQRRMVGLFAFTYVALHFLAYLFFYIEFDVLAMIEDLVDRAYITAGIASFVCLLPMAITSTAGWQRRLRRQWLRLHRLIYPAVALALIHLYWLTRDGFAEVIAYTLGFLVLLAYRWGRG